MNFFDAWVSVWTVWLCLDVHSMQCLAGKWSKSFFRRTFKLLFSFDPNLSSQEIGRERCLILPWVYQRLVVIVFQIWRQTLTAFWTLFTKVLLRLTGRRVLKVWISVRTKLIEWVASLIQFLVWVLIVCFFDYSQCARYDRFLVLTFKRVWYSSKVSLCLSALLF